ncbi:Crp/Fnr family transcriptional regulator, partial [Enterococcus faecalis]|nr:Crp/Fnr family transcriptional regulator [Enterococcus faecalis]
MDINYLLNKKPKTIKVSLKKINKTATIYSSDKRKSYVCLIKSGKVIVAKYALDGERIFLKLLKKNDCFGELELFSATKNLYDIIALTDCEIYFVSYTDIKKWMAVDFSFTEYLFKSMACKLENSSNYIVHSKQYTIYNRFLFLILENKVFNNVEVDKES